MKAILNEPKVEYKVSGWIPSIEFYSIEENIGGIENNIVLVYPLRDINNQLFIEKSLKKLSTLRGKMTKQSEKEIDDQISDLRNEWDRNI
jgi:hypothetical protein